MNVSKIVLFESHYHIRSVRHRENSNKLSYCLLQSYDSKLQLHFFTNRKLQAFIIFTLRFTFLFLTSSRFSKKFRSQKMLTDRSSGIHNRTFLHSKKKQIRILTRRDQKIIVIGNFDTVNGRVMRTSCYCSQ